MPKAGVRRGQAAAVCCCSGTGPSHRPKGSLLLQDAVLPFGLRLVWMSNSPTLALSIGCQTHRHWHCLYTSLIAENVQSVFPYFSLLIHFSSCCATVTRLTQLLQLMVLAHLFQQRFFLIIIVDGSYTPQIFLQNKNIIELERARARTHTYTHTHTHTHARTRAHTHTHTHTPSLC